MRVVTITAGVVSEVSEINRPIADFPNVGYVEAGPEVVVGFTYDGSDFTPHATHAAEVAAVAQAKGNTEARAYLVSTDWMLIRELDGGQPMSTETKTARAAARAEVTP